MALAFVLALVFVLVLSFSVLIGILEVLTLLSLKSLIVFSLALTSASRTWIGGATLGVVVLFSSVVDDGMIVGFSVVITGFLVLVIGFSIVEVIGFAVVDLIFTASEVVEGFSLTFSLEICGDFLWVVVVVVCGFFSFLFFSFLFFS